ncbi:MAG TPA: hypothetical protein VJN69_08705, partial [Candidatus Acidoferrales bacterium]|nr:hypothetical protein [Candidatus Acidoferrales bacterium]
LWRYETANEKRVHTARAMLVATKGKVKNADRETLANGASNGRRYEIKAKKFKGNVDARAPAIRRVGCHKRPKAKRQSEIGVPGEAKN